MRRAFDTLDVNQDGVISYLELKANFERQGRACDDHALREWIRTRDRTGSGVVTYADFRYSFLRGQR